MATWFGRVPHPTSMYIGCASPYVHALQVVAGDILEEEAATEVRNIKNGNFLDH